MSKLGQKRAAEDRIDRDGVDVPTTDPTAPAAATTAPPPQAFTLVKAGHRAEDAPSHNPFRGLTTTSAAGGSAAAPTASSGFSGFGKPTTSEVEAATAANKFSFSFGAAPKAPAAAATSAPTTTSAETPKFSFSFGASAAPAAPSAASTTTTAAPTFSFNFGAPAPAAATTATTPIAPSNAFGGGGFDFSKKFDFGAGVKAFAAAQTAKSEEKTNISNDEEDKKAAAELEAEVAPVVATVDNALSRAPKREDAVRGDESDVLLLQVPHTKAFVLEVRDVVGADGVAKKEKEWKERGVGDLKVSSFEFEGATKHRIIMHSSQTKQLLLNVTIDKWFAVTGSTDKSVAFRTVVFDEKTGGPKPTMYSLKVVETAVKGLLDTLTELAPQKK